MASALEHLRKLRAERPWTAPGPAAASLPRPAVCPPLTGGPNIPEGWKRPVADVLAVLTDAGGPVPYPQIVVALAGQGHQKESARQAIAEAQAQRWIEHNLISGYVLAGEE